MLKKAGIVVAAAAAGLLAVSPLAFAGDKDHDYDHKGGDYSYTETLSEDNDSATNDSGFLSGNNVSAPINVCNNDVAGAGLGGAVNEVMAAASGAASLLGDAEAEALTEDNEVRACDADSELEDNGAAITED